MINICIGSAQFGFNYGITNNVGKVSEDEIEKIMDFSSANGINFFDTAQAYGESEKVLGKFLNKFSDPIVTTKLSSNNKELLRTKCLPEKAKNNDFNGLGSSNIHLNNFIYFALGTPEKHVSKNSPLAQDNNYFFGKIIRIKKRDILKKINNEN